MTIDKMYLSIRPNAINLTESLITKRSAIQDIFNNFLSHRGLFEPPMYEDTSSKPRGYPGEKRVQDQMMYLKTIQNQWVKKSTSRFFLHRLAFNTANRFYNLYHTGRFATSEKLIEFLLSNCALKSEDPQKAYLFHLVKPSTYSTDLYSISREGHVTKNGKSAGFLIDEAEDYISLKGERHLSSRPARSERYQYVKGNLYSIRVSGGSKFSSLVGKVEPRSINPAFKDFKISETGLDLADDPEERSSIQDIFKDFLDRRGVYTKSYGWAGMQVKALNNIYHQLSRKEGIFTSSPLYNGYKTGHFTTSKKLIECALSNLAFETEFGIVPLLFAKPQTPQDQIYHVSESGQVFEDGKVSGFLVDSEGKYLNFDGTPFEDIDENREALGGYKKYVHKEGKLYTAIEGNEVTLGVLQRRSVSAIANYQLSDEENVFQFERSDQSTRSSVQDIFNSFVKNEGIIEESSAIGALFEIYQQGAQKAADRGLFHSLCYRIVSCFYNLYHTGRFATSQALLKECLSNLYFKDTDEKIFSLRKKRRPNLCFKEGDEKIRLYLVQSKAQSSKDVYHISSDGVLFKNGIMESIIRKGNDLMNDGFFADLSGSEYPVNFEDGTTIFNWLHNHTSLNRNYYLVGTGIYQKIESETLVGLGKMKSEKFVELGTVDRR